MRDKTILRVVLQREQVVSSRDERLGCSHHKAASVPPHPSYDRSYISTTCPTFHLANYDIIRYIYVRSKAAKMASLVKCMAQKMKKN